MTPKDKDYIDRQNNQFRNDLDELKNRIIAIEGKLVSNTDGAVRIEFDTAEVYAQLLRSVQDCLEQREAKLRGEDRQRIEQLRAEAEAKGETFYASTYEWQIAMANSFEDFFSRMFGFTKSVDTSYKRVLAALTKAGISPTDNITAEPKEPLFANLPTGIFSATREIGRRLKSRIRTYLSGNFSLPRGYTLLAILLYLALLTLFTLTHISISIT